MERRRLAGLGTVLVAGVALASAAGAANLVLIDRGGGEPRLGSVNGAEVARSVSATSSAGSSSSSTAAAVDATSNEAATEAPEPVEVTAGSPTITEPEAAVTPPASPPATTNARPASPPATSGPTTSEERHRRRTTTSLPGCTGQTTVTYCDD